jgi:phosphoadenosine phosphosulfate reductase
MLSKLYPNSSPVDLIFFDTLFHFDETLDLVKRIQHKYPSVTLHVYKPYSTDTPQEFARVHGDKLWETNDERYDYVAKVEPAQRAYSNLNVKAILTGRRKSQGGKRGDMDIIEVDDIGLIKINPLANWSFSQVKSYISDHDVPYNVLLDRGYKSVGDWHSTSPVAEGEDERAGRWKGREKTECGIHNTKSRYFQYMLEMKRKQERESLRAKLVEVESTVAAASPAIEGDEKEAEEIRVASAS